MGRHPAELSQSISGDQRGLSAKRLQMPRGRSKRRGERWQGESVPYRYSPRTYLQQPAFFGRRIDAEWRPYPPGMADAKLVAASYYQHLAACETLRMAGQRGWGLDELAERLGTRKDTLRRKLYGESPATIDDITGWALAVETVTVLPAPADLDRMLPPTQAT